MRPSTINNGRHRRCIPQRHPQCRNQASLCLSIATCKSENPTPTNNRHLPHSRKYGVTPQNAKSTAIVLTLSESKVQNHQKPNFSLWCRCINPLRSSHKLGVELRPNRQRVIHHHHGAEESCWSVGDGCTGYSNSGRLWSTEYVMEVKVKVAQLLFLESECFRRYGSWETMRFCCGKG